MTIYKYSIKSRKEANIFLQRCILYSDEHVTIVPKVVGTMQSSIKYEIQWVSIKISLWNSCLFGRIPEGKEGEEAKFGPCRSMMAENWQVIMKGCTLPLFYTELIFELDLASPMSFPVLHTHTLFPAPGSCLCQHSIQSDLVTNSPRNSQAWFIF